MRFFFSNSNQSNMVKLSCILLLPIIYERTFGLNLRWLHKEKRQEHLCDKNLIESNLDMSPHSLYYMRLYHCDYDKEHGKPEQFPQFNAPNFRSEKNDCTLKWTENVQENRIPRVLMTADCGSTCESISYKLSVLKLFLCDCGYSVYREEIQTISVACVPKHNRSAIPKVNYTNLVVKSRITNTPAIETLVYRNGVTFEGVKDPD